MTRRARSASWIGTVRPVVSIVVPVRNGAQTIGACVESLLAQDYPRDRYEVIVVNNRSTDATPELLRRYPVSVLEERVRQSSYAARNRGIAAARGALVAFTDADCLAEPTWLSRLIEGYPDARYGAFAGRVVAHRPATILERFAEQRRQVSQDASMACSFLPYAITANVAYRRELLQALGGFDERLISGGDADLAWRLQLAQRKAIRFNKDAVVFHQHRKTLRGLLRQHRLYGYGTAMLYARYPGYRKPLRAETGIWVKRSIWFGLRGMVRVAQWPFRRRRDGLYYAEHFLEVLATTSRFMGLIRYRGVRAPSEATERGSGLRAAGSAAGPQPGAQSPTLGQPTVSIIIPSYNRAHLIGEALESVLAQTYPDWEVVVVDDGSQDQTRDVVQRYGARFGGRLRYVFQENQGLSAARNAGCRAAAGRYLAFLDSDDTWKPEKLARQVPLLEQDPAVGLVSSMAEVVDAPGVRVLAIKPKTAPGATLRELVFRGSAAPSSFVARREALEDVGYFDPAITKGIEDLDLCFRLAARWKLVCLEQPLIRYRQHGASLSADPEGTCRGFIRTYEKLLAAADGDIPRGEVRRRLAKQHYHLGAFYARRRQAREAAGEFLAAVSTAPLVGLAVADEQPWWRRGVALFKPYAALCGLGALALLGNGRSLQMKKAEKI